MGKLLKISKIVSSKVQSFNRGSLELSEHFTHQKSEGEINMLITLLK